MGRGAPLELVGVRDPTVNETCTSPGLSLVLMYPSIPHRQQGRPNLHSSAWIERLLLRMVHRYHRLPPSARPPTVTERAHHTPMAGQAAQVLSQITHLLPLLPAHHRG